MAYISITDFGAKGDGKTDNRSALQQAFNYAKANNVDVYIPAGVFAHSGTLSADGIRIFGDGDSSVLKSTQFGQEALILRGDGVSVSDIRMEGVGSSRLTTDESVQILVQNATNFTIERVHINGSSSAGIKVNRSSFGYIADNLIENTRADSIHMVLGSHDILVERNRTLYSGDDGISVVSYQGGGMVSNITIRNNETLYNKGGRGIAVLGGRDVLIQDNLVEGGTADRAGIYIAAEREWNTESVYNVRVTGNTIKDAGGLSVGHGAITLYNSQPGAVIQDVIVDNNEIHNPRKMGILTLGSGEQEITLYNNKMYGGSYGLLVDLGNTTISTSEPPPPPSGSDPDPNPNPNPNPAPGTITGTSGHDVLNGTDAGETINGLAGNDRIDGGAGNDRIDGGEGDDVIFGGEGDDIIIGGPGVDIAAYKGVSTDFAITIGKESITVRDLNPDDGDEGTDTVMQPMGQLQFADRIVFVDGRNNAPVAVTDKASTDEDTVVKGSVLANDVDFDKDPLTVTAGTFTTAQGATLTLAADGTFTYDPRNAAKLQALDTGQSVVDTFTYRVSDGKGGTANGTLEITVTGVIDGNTQPGTITGTSGHDVLNGTDAGETINGLAGNDWIDGGAGNDRIDGGAGADWLRGGPGADTFVFAPGYGQDIINWIENGVDKVDLSAFGLSGMNDLAEAAKTSTGVAENGASYVILDFGNGDRLMLNGISKVAAEHIIF